MTDFIPGTWADLRPTHRQIPDSVSEARAAAEAAWKRRDDLIDRLYYGGRPGAITQSDIDAAEQDALDLEAAAAVAWSEWGIPSSDDDDRPNPYDFFDIQ